MINIPCRKCCGTDIFKNGLTKAGAQKYHCKSCNFYGTLVTQEEKQKMKEALIEKPLRERVSQRGIARLAGVSRCRVISVIKKRNSARCIRYCWKGKTSGCGNRRIMVVRRIERALGMDMARDRPGHPADCRSRVWGQVWLNLSEVMAVSSSWLPETCCDI